MQFQMQKEQCKTPSNMKTEGNMTSPKVHGNLPVIKPKDMAIYDLPNKEFKTGVLRKLNQL